ncbi:MAG: tetratricopeptide repeat protein, partial [Proteobacteria bacterium]|nr:tetratricopeptide repeat protein [Pseudomonadota bacterium]
MSLAAASVAGVVPARAQVSRPVVQPIPGGDAMRLNAALGRLARNPRDVDALIEAGAASLAAGDGDAAIGFYQKADALSPGNARIKSGLAGAYVLTGDPANAIPLFDAAEKLGPLDAARVSDRGLAFDMVGDATTAQRYYREALMAGPSDETSRRLALSQAISGDRKGMEVTLASLLQRNDKAAWRTRAFALAILNQPDEAESIARSTMPADMAGAMVNYLRYMPKLTAAQQATAANLGQFPRAAEIGRDDPRFALLVRTRPVLASAVPVARVAQRDDKKSRKDRSAPTTKAAEVPLVAPVTIRPGPSGELPPIRSAAVAIAPQPAVTVKPVTPPPVLTPPMVASTTVAIAPAAAPQPLPQPVVTPAATIAPSAPVAAPRIDLPAPAVTPPPTPTPVSSPGFASLENPAPKFDLKPSAPPAPAPTPVVRPVPVQPAPAKPAAPARPRSLAEVFADLTPPSREAEPEAGAVDLRKIKASAPVTKPAASETKATKLAETACEVPDPKAGKAAKSSRTAKGAKAKAAAKDLPALC